MKFDKFCIVGKPVSTSLSPNIYNHLFDLYKTNAHYSRLFLNDVNQFKKIIKLLDLCGLNITMPHKQSAFQIAEVKDDYSLLTESTNTMIIKDIIYGFNTDYSGFLSTIKQKYIELKGKSILIIGAGNTSGTVIRSLESFNCSIYIVNRSLMNAKIMKNTFNSINVLDKEQMLDYYDIIINASPDISFLDEQLQRITANTIIDFNYKCNQLNRKIKYYDNLINGKELLIQQAIIAYSLYADNIPSINQISDISLLFNDLCGLLNSFNFEKTNISLIGLTGVGKSSISKELAKKLNKNYISTDDLIEKEMLMSITEIFEKYGEDGFRSIESKMLKTLENVDNSVIDTGGGICKEQKNIDILKAISYNIFIIDDLENTWKRITASNRPIISKMTFPQFKDLFTSRLDNYFKCSDLIAINSSSIEHTVELLLPEIERVLC